MRSFLAHTSAGGAAMTLPDSRSVALVLTLHCWLGCTRDNDMLPVTPRADLAESPAGTDDLASVPSDDLAVTPPPVSCATGAIEVNAAAELQQALLAAHPGDHICIAAGTYAGDPAKSGASGVTANFFSDKSGTASAPIVVESIDPARPALLQGSGTAVGSGYVLYVTGDYWQIKNIKVTKGSKGIMFDHVHHARIAGVEVSDIGDEGIHLRDGSSDNVLEEVRVHDTGRAQPDYGEGIYIGSWFDAGYNQQANGNTILNSSLGPNIGSKAINVQPNAANNAVDGCSFDATGMTGANAGYSFLSIKGPETLVRNSTFNRNGNTVITDAIAISYSHSTVRDNVFNLDDASAYVIKAFSNGSATAANNTRKPSGNMYRGPVM
jgi:hypothetical protein